MIDHMGFAVTDLARARRFYDACAGALGLATIDNSKESFLIARSFDAAVPFLWIGTAWPRFWSKGNQASASPLHLCFAADSRDAVDRFYAAALEAGGKDNGAPGPRGASQAAYYAAYVLDPDGNNIEAGVRGTG